MKIAIIDDSRLARQELRYLLKDMENVEIVGEAANANEARLLINETRPDLLLLDIQMPEEDGFALLSSLEDCPEVIFVTAYNHYAEEAFKVNALDYLQKPIEGNRLQLAIKKCSEKLLSREQNRNEEILAASSKIFIKDGEKCWFVELNRIFLFESDEGYTRVYFEKNKPLITKSLQLIEQRLSDKLFFRANRSQLVNINYIDRIEPWFSGSLKLFLKPEVKEIEVSRRQSSLFKNLMSL